MSTHVCVCACALVHACGCDVRACLPVCVDCVCVSRQVQLEPKDPGNPTRIFDVVRGMVMCKVRVCVSVSVGSPVCVSVGAWVYAQVRVCTCVLSPHDHERGACSAPVAL